MNIVLDQEITYFRKFVVWDMEAILIKKQERSSDKLQWVSKHKPSVSIASNVMGYKTPFCFVNENPENVIEEMMEYINKISKNQKPINLFSIN